MGKEKIDLQFIFFVTFVTFPVVILFPAGQPILCMLFPLITILLMLLSGSSFVRRQLFVICLSTALLTSFLIVKIKNLSYVSTGIPKDCVTSITGYVIYDSSFTKSNNHFMTIYITQVRSVYGQCATAKGLVNVIGDERAIITSGIKIQLNGRFNDDLFKYGSLQVLTRSRLNDIREFLITEIEKRILNKNTDDAALLSIMLLLGRAEDNANKIKLSAQTCGCTHVLALSGMHLNILTILFKPIKNKAVKYVLSVCTALLFVFVAGPRPSLIRALLMLIFSFLPTVERLTVCFVLQTILFPFSVLNIGCIYSYLSIIAIVFVNPLLKGTTILKGLTTSASVLLLIVPVELYTTGSWNPWAMVVGPIASVLVAASMLIGLFLLILGSVRPLVQLNNLVYQTLSKLFSFFENKNTAGKKEYIIFALIIILKLLSIFIFKLLLKYRFKKTDKKLIINP